MLFYQVRAGLHCWAFLVLKRLKLLFATRLSFAVRVYFPLIGFPETCMTDSGYTSDSIFTVGYKAFGPCHRKTAHNFDPFVFQVKPYA